MLSWPAAFHLAHWCPPLDIEDVRAALMLAASHGHHPYDGAQSRVDHGLAHPWKKDMCPFEH